MLRLTCEQCGTSNPAGVKFCKQCGNKLTWDTADSDSFESAQSKTRSPLRKPIELAGSSASVQGGKRYGALRGIASFCRLMSYIFVGLNGLAALYGLSVLFDSFLLGVGYVILAAISGGVAYIFWNIIAESISVLLDIEENTRRTAGILEQSIK